MGLILMLIVAGCAVASTLDLGEIDVYRNIPLCDEWVNGVCQLKGRERE